MSRQGIGKPDVFPKGINTTAQGGHPRPPPPASSTRTYGKKTVFKPTVRALPTLITNNTSSSSNISSSSTAAEVKERSAISSSFWANKTPAVAIAKPIVETKVGNPWSAILKKPEDDKEKEREEMMKPESVVEAVAEAEPVLVSFGGNANGDFTREVEFDDGTQVRVTVERRARFGQRMAWSDVEPEQEPQEPQQKRLELELELEPEPARQPENVEPTLTTQSDPVAQPELEPEPEPQAIPATDERKTPERTVDTWGTKPKSDAPLPADQQQQQARWWKASLSSAKTRLPAPAPPPLPLTTTDGIRRPVPKAAPPKPEAKQSREDAKRNGGRRQSAPIPTVVSPLVLLTRARPTQRSTMLKLSEDACAAAEVATPAMATPEPVALATPLAAAAPLGGAPDLASLDRLDSKAGTLAKKPSDTPAKKPGDTPAKKPSDTLSLLALPPPADTWRQTTPKPVRTPTDTRRRNAAAAPKPTSWRAPAVSREPPTASAEPAELPAAAGHTKVKANAKPADGAAQACTTPTPQTLPTLPGPSEQLPTPGSAGKQLPFACGPKQRLLGPTKKEPLPEPTKKEPLPAPIQKEPLPAPFKKEQPPRFDSLFQSPFSWQQSHASPVDAAPTPNHAWTQQQQQPMLPMPPLSAAPFHLSTGSTLWPSALPHPPSASAADSQPQQSAYRPAPGRPRPIGTRNTPAHAHVANEQPGDPRGFQQPWRLPHAYGAHHMHMHVTEPLPLQAIVANDAYAMNSAPAGHYHAGHSDGFGAMAAYMHMQPHPNAYAYALAPHPQQQHQHQQHQHQPMYPGLGGEPLYYASHHQIVHPAQHPVPYFYPHHPAFALFAHTANPANPANLPPSYASNANSAMPRVNPPPLAQPAQMAPQPCALPVAKPAPANANSAQTLFPQPANATTASQSTSHHQPKKPLTPLKPPSLPTPTPPQLPLARGGKPRAQAKQNTDNSPPVADKAVPLAHKPPSAHKSRSRRSAKKPTKNPIP
ncbi:hypothetical protein LPJ66_003811 [Kickxella alabastrina]|uniref:Uncharacterized protein n=1 Tax=Kickxella alabastrina TaxID=61397 RepID=A0ACC1IIR0_9FUNG|nr:hypothetical protein LPJ66_003811 [Kickxella alabastrina]